MTAIGELPAEKHVHAGDTSGKFKIVTTARRVVIALTTINAITLFTMTCWLYFDRNATDRSESFLSEFQWWTLDWGVYIPVITDKVKSAASAGATVIGYLCALSSLILAEKATLICSNRERIALPTIGVILGAGWLFIGTNWDIIRLRGQSVELVQYCNTISEFAVHLDETWPDQGGEIEDFGAFLAYPYGKPRTLLMLGDASIPNTPLKVAAVERSPGEAIRFQLAGDAPQVWFEWRPENSSPMAFEGGLQQVHLPKTQYQVADNLFVVRYEIRESANGS